jgi:uncharacterized repeat protein (TIGR03803 family)
VQDAKGNLFGTTVMGGSTRFGTLFKITPTNQYIVLDNFDYLRAGPGGLTIANDGKLYGTTGASPTGLDCGTMFEVTPAGTYSLLYTFANGDPAGCNPTAELFQGTNGILYGTAVSGAAPGGDGAVYTLSNALSPLVEVVPPGGKAGNRVLILGNGLTGTTSVTFNGMPAQFTVGKDTFIKAIVPAGATTGTVSVVTPSGTLNSNPQFVVTK